MHASYIFFTAQKRDNANVLALDIADVFEALAKCVYAVGVRLRRRGAEQSHNRHRRLLRLRHNRPRYRHAAEQRD